MAHYRSSSEIQSRTDKLSLPNFSNFLAGAGQPDLAYRTEALPHNVAQNPTFSPQSLPTPPGTSCYSWPTGEDARQQVQLDSNLNMTEPQGLGQSHGQSEYRRRSSANIPMVPSHDNRSTRSYSYTNSTEDHLELHVQQHGRIVREEIIPGKGLCYIYDDGTVCPKIVNGDTVNPKWGTTKAGKPRKRLGQACNTCREKKIKCDPSYPKCTQCQKLGRECKFEAPSRPGQKSPKLRTSASSPVSGYVPEETLMTRRSSTTPTEASTPTETNSNAPTKPPMNVTNLLSPSSEKLTSGYQPSPTKRLRLNPPESNLGLAPSPVNIDNHNGQDHLKMFGFRSDLDPIHVDRKLVEHYLDVYFTKANVAAFGMFPPTHFCEWARTAPKKEQDIMVMYAVLALATVFSKNADKLLHRQAFMTLAHLLLNQHVYSLSLQTVQVGHLMSLVEFAEGDDHQAFSLGRQAASAACWLGLNTEVDSTSNQTMLYGLSPAQLTECKRRSFWAVYITERFGGACLGHPLAISHHDVFLRLPCDPQSYDGDRIPETPLFDNENVVSKLNKNQAHHELATMAHLAQIATLCSDAQTIAKRMKQNLTIGRPTTDSSTRKKLEQQLTYWDEGYQLAAKARDRDAKDSDESAGRISGGRSEKLSGLHILYHFAHISLNRQIYHPKLSKQDIATHVRKTYSHAMRILEIAQQLVSRGCIETIDYGFTSTAPLTAFAVFMAVDVITATGTISDVLENQSRMMQLLYNGIELLGQLADYWKSAKLQHKIAQERCQIMFTRVSASLMERKIAFYLSTPLSPMATILGMDFDLVYGIGRMQYLQALGWANEITNENELLEIEILPETLAQRGTRHAPSKSSSF